MLYLIAYILVGLVMAQRIFALFIRHQYKEWGDIENEDIAFAALFAVLLGAIWPPVLLGHIVYKFALEPTIEALRKEHNER